MNTWVWVEHAGGKLDTASLAALGAAAPLQPLTLLLPAGPGADEAAAQAAAVTGVVQVRVLGSDDAIPRVEMLAPVLAKAVSAEGATHLLAASNAQGRALLPRVAALLDVMPLSDVVRIVDAECFVRPVHAGAALMTLRSADRVKVLTLRSSAFPPAVPGSGASAPVARLPLPAPDTPATRLLKRNKPEAGDLPQLIGARIVVSGGRGVGSNEGYAKLLPLARQLGAALGASRAAVDAGYAAADQQVGQTGKAVAPDIYLAFGISGAIQHLAGMKDAKTIVAVNTDPEAPIFQVADYGLVDDLFKVLPELEAAASESRLRL